MTATVFREGHEMLGAGVVLTDPDGVQQPLAAMRELAEGTDRYGAQVAATREGLWHFAVEAWGDPIARWQHDAAIKIPIGQDTELMLAEGALLLRRAAVQIATPRTMPPEEARLARAARSALTRAAAKLTDPEIAPLATAGRGRAGRRGRRSCLVPAPGPADQDGELSADRAPAAGPV